MIVLDIDVDKLFDWYNVVGTPRLVLPNETALDPQNVRLLKPLYLRPSLSRPFADACSKQNTRRRGEFEQRRIVRPVKHQITQARIR